MIDLVNVHKDGHDLCFYVETIANTEIDPINEMQPWVVVRQRKNHIQGMILKYEAFCLVYHIYSMFVF